MQAGRIGGAPGQGRLAVPGVAVGQGVAEEPARCEVVGGLQHELLGRLQVAPIVGGAGDQIDGRAEPQGVLQRDREGVLDVLLRRFAEADRGVGGALVEVLGLDVAVAAVVERGLQGVGRAQVDAALDAAAPGLVVIIAAERLLAGLQGLLRVVVREQAVLEGVVEGLGLQIAGRADLGVGQEIDAVDVPVGPVPVALRGQGVVDVIGRALGAFLVGVADRVFVGGVRGPAGLDVDPPIVGFRMVAIAAVLNGGGGEVFGQGGLAAVHLGGRDLQVAIVLAHAQHTGGQVAVGSEALVEAGADAGLQLERLGRLAGHQVDGAAQAAGAVQHRHIALCDLDFGQVRGQEATEVQPVVGRQVYPHAVDRQGGLEPVKATDIDQPLVARAARIGLHRAGHQIERAVQVLLGELAQLRRQHHGAADLDALAVLGGHPHFAQGIDRIAVGGGGDHLALGEGGQAGRRQGATGEQKKAQVHVSVSPSSLCF